MKKGIHPVCKQVTFKCATCGAQYKIMSTSKSDSVSIDVCANCHPVFIGKQQETNIKGRAEKLAKKFKTPDALKPNKKTRIKKTTKKIISSLDEINQ